MDLSSPVKRRVLGALDPNTSSPNLHHPHQPSKTKQPSHFLAKLTRPPLDKQPVMEPGAQEADSRPAKRLRLEDDQPQSQFQSPVAPSVFDNSTADTSQATTLTEPDAGPESAIPMPMPVPPRPERTRPTPNHSELRRAAQTLRARLGLAAYRVNTDQLHVPFEELERRQTASRSTSRHISNPHAASLLYTQAIPQARRPLPNAPSAAGRAHLAAAAPRGPVARRLEERNARLHYEGRRWEEDTLPRLPVPQRNMPPPRTPPRTRPENEERLSSSALQNGAASGLLSLSRS